MRPPPHPEADRLLVVWSDIEMGAGGPLDDLPDTGFLAERIASYARPPFDGMAVELVFAGDTFDFLKTPVDGRYPTRITAQVALEKLEAIHGAHEDFFQALRAFLSGPDRSAVFLLGNHDLELAFPEVQGRIAHHAGGRNVRFPGLAYEVGDVLVEHGMQGDPLFALDPPDERFHLVDGERVLALPWGAVALLDVALPLHGQLHPLDRLRPRERLMAVLPEARDLLVNAYWRYWTRDWWKDFWTRHDPNRKVSWTMLKEIVYRFGSTDTEVRVGDRYRKLAQRDGLPRIVVIGHLHQPAWWQWADCKLLQNGCLRDEYLLAPDGAVLRPLPKTYTEVYLRDGRAVRSHLVEIDGRTDLPAHMPRYVQELLPVIRPLLGPPERREELASAQRRQERREARRR